MRDRSHKGGCASLALVALLALASTGAATPAPSVDAGWPISSLGGTLHAGPGSGVVEVGAGEHRTLGIVAVNAFGAGRRALWSSGVGGECGNCAAVLPEGPRADGSYAPAGFTFTGSLYAISAAGARSTRAEGGCTGLVMSDRACIAVESGPGQGPLPISATRDGVVLWRYTDPALAVRTGESDLNFLARDATGTVYVTNQGAGPETLLVALDGRTGQVRWRQSPAPFAGRVLASLDDGVLMVQGDVLAAVGSSGAIRWQLPLPGFVRARVDTSSRRVYVEQATPHRGGDLHRVSALDLDDGKILWLSGGAPGTRLLAVGPRRVLVARDTGSAHDLRALAPDGTTLWRWKALARVQSAVVGTDGHVYANVESLQGSSPSLMFRLDPEGRASRPPARPGYRVTRRPEPRCRASSCPVTGREGTVLRLSMPRATRISWVVGTAPIRKPYWYAGFVTAPVGTSSVRILVPPVAARTRLALRLTWREGGRNVVHEVPLPARP